MKRKKYIQVDARHAASIERAIKNSILAHGARVYGGGLFQPQTPEGKAERVAEMVCRDLLADYRLTRRK
jgi:hypothetical protein